MRPLAWWGVGLAVGFEYLVWVVLDLLVVSALGGYAKRHQFILESQTVSSARSMKQRTARWTRRAAGPPRHST